MTFELKTKYPVAISSPDHTHPWGTKRDNSTKAAFITEVETYFGGKKLTFLDLGCSGGQLTIDCNKRGHAAVGLEGSDYSVKNGRANWPQYYNKCLFTCDVCKPFKLLFDGAPAQFDCITA